MDGGPVKPAAGLRSRGGEAVRAPPGRGGNGRGGRTRVLHVVQSLDYGGMERLIGEIVRRLDGGSFEPGVLVLQRVGPFGEGLEEHADLQVAGDLPPWSMLWPRKLARVIRRFAPDIVHTHSGVWYKAARAARMAGVPRLVHTEHGRSRPDPWSHRLVDRLASRRTDLTVAVSDPLEEDLAEQVGVDRGGIRVVTNGVDTRRFRPRSPERRRNERETLGLDDDGPVLGSVGRLEPVKGYQIMIDAFHRLVHRWPDDRPAPRLVLVGDGRRRATLEREAAGGPGDVRFLGWRNDVPSLHAAFDLFTLSSHSEGTSVSLLEAMSSGLCPVVTEVGGNAEVLGPDLGHRLVPAADPEALVGAWRRALTEPAARREDAQRARRRVVDSYSIEAMVRSYERVYRAASGRGDGAV